jgi:hypothetical protein
MVPLETLFSLSSKLLYKNKNLHFITLSPSFLSLNTLTKRLVSCDLNFLKTLSTSKEMDSLDDMMYGLNMEVDDVGRISKQPDDEDFLVSVPPEIKDNTRIVAICGTPEESADPEVDGWFLSDFYLFNYLFKGTGSHQVWLANESPEALVSKYGEFLHGNPFGKRRVVLDEKMVNKDCFSPVTVVPEPHMVRAFIHHVKTEAKIAKEKSEPLLIMMFGHGTEEFGVFLGKHDELSPSRLVFMKDVESAIPPGVEMTLFSNACFSGGWAVHMNATTFAAAGPFKTSTSWPQSRSASRACGSIWASMIVQALREEVEQPVEAAYISNTPFPEHAQQKSLAAFVASCHSILLEKTDRLGRNHNILFSAQDDDWGRSWTGRTGIPLQKFGRRFEDLEIRESTQDQKDPTNRDPQAAVEYSAEALRLWLAQDSNDVDLVAEDMKARLGCIPSGKSLVEAQCRLYKLSNPGIPNLAPNTALEGMMHKIATKDNVSWKELSAVLSIVRYRLSTTFVATKLLEAVDVPLPHGQRCFGWDAQNFVVDKSKNNIYGKIRTMIREADIFPTTAGHGMRQGLPFYKPREYLAAGLLEWVLARNATFDDLQKKIQDIRAVVEVLTERQKEDLRAHEPIRSRKRRWVTSLGKRWRSPEKKARAHAPTELSPPVNVWSSSSNSDPFPSSTVKRSGDPSKKMLSPSSSSAESEDKGKGKRRQG